MSKKILISTKDQSESRVAVVEGSLLIDFDSEVVAQKPLRGNIYLARVVRVEPSLQAVFVEFNDGKCGFLPFSEIHRDYYRIPVDDRNRYKNERIDDNFWGEDSAEEAERATYEHDSAESEYEARDAFELHKRTDAEHEFGEEYGFPDQLGGTMVYPSLVEDHENESAAGDESKHAAAQNRKKKKFRKRYNVQEVIHNKQVLLVQVTKDERGNKGAAVTTYLSLAGQYCVLMPNAGDRNGGISRRIHNDDDRKRLKDVIDELNVPEKMSLVIRTAGQERNKKEIRRDYEYLLRLWNEIRKKTLESSAPTLINEEADFLHRSIRSFYKKEIDEIIVDSKEAYKKVRDFMRHLSSVGLKKVKLHTEGEVSLFNFYNVEQQILDMVSPRVELPSGGSIVIGQTEALVAIDVNSGRATKERHIDTTALKTNLEASKEIARQLRLRDLSGLIVIDFIGMSEPKHIQQVERVFRQEIANDHAKIQTANISQFGLLEMSRQRIRSSVMETYGAMCPHCQGRGVAYSKLYFVSTVLRFLEKIAFENKGRKLDVYTPRIICHELLNNKRKEVYEIEQQNDCIVTINVDETLDAISFAIDCGTGVKSQFSLGNTDEHDDENSDIEEEERWGMRRNSGQNEHDAVPVAVVAAPDQRQKKSASGKFKERSRANGEIAETGKLRKNKKRTRRVAEPVSVDMTGPQLLEPEEQYNLEDSQYTVSATTVLSTKSLGEVGYCWRDVTDLSRERNEEAVMVTIDKDGESGNLVQSLSSPHRKHNHLKRRFFLGRNPRRSPAQGRGNT
jgi:ribonuclease E